MPSEEKQLVILGEGKEAQRLIAQLHQSKAVREATMQLVALGDSTRRLGDSLKEAAEVVREAFSICRLELEDVEDLGFKLNKGGPPKSSSKRRRRHRGQGWNDWNRGGL